MSTAAAVATAPTPPVSGRIMSIDALRGFDMFWIAGGKEVVVAILMLFISALPPALEHQLEHVPWEGFVAWDLIMPLFLFISGTSMPFAFSKRTLEGQSRRTLYLRLFRRIVLLWILGTIAQGNLLQSIFSLDFSNLHLYSNTLQSIASGYLIAAIALIFLPQYGQFLLTILLLVVYWALMRFVPFPGHSAGTLESDANLALYVDEAILGRFRDGTAYTWILSSLAFAGSVLLGVMSGHILRSSREPKRKCLMLFAAGLLCLALGRLWAIDFPIIKHLWTSSMVLWAGGWSFLLLALFYLVIDIGGWRAWAYPFVVVGANAIVAYMGRPIVEFTDHLLDWAPGALGSFGAFLQALVAFLTLWIVLYVLYWRKWFIRV